ncbi:peptide ABC transporter permease [Carnobacterium viridans]|uniref:Peptide/nickel transport system permease protein n=1 Tax=Carnobacterium viridans TaxID=174587 RepID=A0A1H1A963_9LACT|nr:peptide ABC transporter permease [Carnobacterium viridans]UDE94247.1 peptide ABC transporter permease [Carnobacterium viridans]SDQ36197.1 peptide/nickel transport system permease protein [Carnobacterium viridans]
MKTLKNKNNPLWILCSIVLFFLLLSCLYEPLLSKVLTIRVEKTIVNGEVKYPPFTPLEVLPFGTDIIGFTIFAKIIQGFKYTFFIGLLLSIAQILSSLFINMLTLHKLGSKILLPLFSYFDKLFTLIPKPFLLLLLIAPYSDALFFNTDNVQPSANLKFVMIQLFILFLVGIPNLVKLYHSELNFLFKQDFAFASQTLGSSKFRMISYSFKPQLTELTLNLFFKILTQNLSLFIYLAYFQLYLGGSLVTQLDASTTYTATISNEWSGLIGQNINRLASTPWTVLIPLAFYGAFILLLNGIKRSLTGGMQNQSI